MSIERRSKLWSGPPIVPADPATERDQLIAANQAFAAALKKALQNGAETSAGVLATVSSKRGKNGHDLRAPGCCAEQSRKPSGRAEDSGPWRSEARHIDC